MDYFNKLCSDKYLNDFNEFRNLKEFVKFIVNQEEVVVYTLGTIGEKFLDWLQYSDYIPRFPISCVATKETRQNNTQQRYSHSLPVIPLEMLVHFSDTALFVVVSPPAFHEDIAFSLSEIGCKKVIFLKEPLLKAVEAERKKLLDSGQAMNWLLNHSIKSLDKIGHRMDVQNEIYKVHTKAFADFKNLFLGKKIVIIGNGPTLKYYDPIPDAIHIGVNRGWSYDGVPLNYLFIIDCSQDFISNFDEVKKSVRDNIFCGMHIEMCNAHYLQFPEKILLSNKVRKFLVHTFHGYSDLPIYRDICSHLLRVYGTVVFSAMQFALYTHPKEIYLVGCDTAQTGHFYSVDIEKEISSRPWRIATHAVKVGYSQMKMFARLHYPDTEIVSINPIGLKGLFTDVFTEKYLKHLSGEID